MSPSTNEIKNLEKSNLNKKSRYSKLRNVFYKFFEKMQTFLMFKGMPGMDAVALLENLKVKVKVIGIGKVKRQSIQPGNLKK
jgi:cell division protein FtsI (penicillin-binding protein 3)